MAGADGDDWSDRLRRTLACYDEELLRAVAARLVKPRNQWPAEELIERGVGVAENLAVLDRRLREVEPAGRQLLALIAHSRQPCWHLGNLVELLLALGQEDGLKPVFHLLEAGLLFPVLGRWGEAPAGRVKNFEQWLAFPGPTGLLVFTTPLIASRALGEDLGLPDLSADGAPGAASAAQEADGLEWLLRLAVLWQQVAAAPLRRTQQGGFFKRDADRLGLDPLLNGPPSDRLADVPDLGFLVEALAELAGVVRIEEAEVRAGALPAAWDAGPGPALEALYADLPRLTNWGPQGGWRGGDAAPGNPFPSAYLLTFLLLARLPEGAWARPDALEAWLLEHHPYWKGESVRPSQQQPWLGTFLLGVAYHLRVMQAARDEAGEWLVRLSPTGRWLLGLAEAPAPAAVYTQTLLVQPNLEVIAYRQGLTPALLGRLTRFAAWKSLGAACTLQLGPESVYRALEAGETYDSIRLALEQHGARAIPPAVLDSLRTWSNKRDRITVYPSATLLEFAGAADLDEALARGLPAVRVADNLAVVADEGGIDFRHFRLTGTRDYSLPPERCVSVEPDGVTLSVDLSRSDLLLETELPRFAEALDRPGADGRRRYRLTPASLAAARECGLTEAALEAWCQQRAGQPLPPAARLLMTAGQAEAPRLQRHLVLHVADPEVADGLLQWPETSGLIEAQLGPTALAVAEEKVELLRQRLRAAGIVLAE
ncbi:MAG TPA: helicase-associated domain-containing protein [Gemmataceae bacterium]|nr:helicase-associated domain-containing protein [Gemmataceae bacterium]